MLFSDVVNKRNLVKRSKVLDSSSRVSASREVEGHTNKPEMKKQPQRNSVLGASTASTFKAAENLQVKKAIFRIGNVSSEYNAEDLNDHVKSLGIRTISCFELPHRSFLPDDNKQFRICIFCCS